MTEKALFCTGTGGFIMEHADAPRIRKGDWRQTTS